MKQEKLFRFISYAIVFIAAGLISTGNTIAISQRAEIQNATWAVDRAHLDPADSPNDLAAQLRLVGTATVAATKSVVTSTSTPKLTATPQVTPTASKTHTRIATSTWTLTSTATSRATASPTRTVSPVPATATPSRVPTEITTPEAMITDLPTSTPDRNFTELGTPTPEVIQSQTPRPGTPTLTPAPVPTRIDLGWHRFFTPMPVPSRSAMMTAIAQNRRATATATPASGSPSGKSTETLSSLGTPPPTGSADWFRLFGSTPTRIARAPLDPSEPEQSSEEPLTETEDFDEGTTQANTKNLLQQVVIFVGVGGSFLLFFASGILGTVALYLFVRAQWRKRRR